MLLKVAKNLLVPLAMGMLLMACDRGSQESVQHSPVAIEPGKECHLCGMIITRFPGPKGEAFVRRNEQALMFCSTRDLFAWLLQPEVTSQVEAVYVHDMEKGDWANPQDDAMIDAYKAWYVVGSDRKGAMGATLASFVSKAAAEKFANEHGGQILQFSDINLELLQTM